MMRIFIIYIWLTILFCSCGQKGVLLENSWIVLDGKYKNGEIDFKSNDFVKLIDNKGNEILNLHFFKNGKIILPGIKSPKISARWRIDEERIWFTLDSSEYYMYNSFNKDLTFLEITDSLIKKNENTKSKTTPVFDNKEFERVKESMKIYTEPFKYYISLDTLVLKSENTLIRAKRDRTIDDLMKYMK